MRRLRIALLALATAACGGGDATPEARVRSTLAAIEAAAEARDVAGVKEHVSESYRDAAGRDRRAVGALAFAHFQRNASVHLLTRVSALEIPAPGEARAEVLVAMAGRPIPSVEALPALRADLYRFELTLRDEDGDWRVVAAQWRPATLQDFR